MITKKKTPYEAPELTVTVISTEHGILNPSRGTGERFGEPTTVDSGWDVDD